MKIVSGTAVASILRLAVPLLVALPLVAAAQSRDAQTYELLLNRDGRIKSLAIINGSIAVNAPGGSLNLAHDVTVMDGHVVVADNLRIQVRARVGDVFANTLFKGRDTIVTGTITQPVLPPVFDTEPLVVPDPFDPVNFPPNFPITCGGPGKAGQMRETFTLLPGTYGAVSVASLGKLILQPGSYQFCSLAVGHSGAIVVNTPVTIDIVGSLGISADSTFLPIGSPALVEINVMGPEVRFGSRVIFNGRLFAPLAKLRVGADSIIMGRLVADRMQTDGRPVLFPCGNGKLDQGEQCDTTAPNGDKACPGMCVPPGQPNECTCQMATTTTTTSTTSTTSTTTTSTTTTIVVTTTTTSSSTTTVATTSTTTTVTPSTTPETTPTTTTLATTTTTIATTTTTVATTTTTVATTTTSTTLPARCAVSATGPCVITVSSLPGTSFVTLSAAVNAAPDGTASAPTRIHVSGRCVGPPALISGRSNLVVEGDPPPTACPEFGPEPTTLTSSLSPDGSTPPTGSGGETIKVLSSTNISIRFLNLVDADPEDAVDYKSSTGGDMTCNCCARNEECFEISGGSGEVVKQNFITDNGHGINTGHAAHNVMIMNNTVVSNRRFFGTDVEQGDGITLFESSTAITVVGNIVKNNLDDGIDLENASSNTVTDNVVMGNGFTDAGAPTPGGNGIVLQTSNNNLIDCNTISGNADGLVDRARVLSGTGNTGSNVSGTACVR